MKLLILSKENLDLSVGEVKSFSKKIIKKENNLMICEIKNYERLSYTKKVLEILFYVKEDYLIKSLKKTNFSKIIKKDYCIRIFDKLKNKNEILKTIYLSLKKPIINLTNPKSVIEFYFVSGKIVCGKVIWQNQDDFSLRKAHNRPEHHPTSINPRLAKACINLTGIKKGKIVDPFCGSGGILIEAGLLNLKPIGYDIDQIMINRSRINLDYYKIKDYELNLKNALTLNKTKFIVTDPPYGRNTNPYELDKLYSDFIRVLDRKLLSTCVLIHPSNISLKKLIKKSNLIIENEFSVYIHKSLTRIISVIKKL